MKPTMGKLLAAAAICCIVALVCLAQLTEATKGYIEKPKKIHFVHVPKPVFVKVEKKVPVVKYKPIFIPKPIIVKKIEKVPVIKKVHIIKEVKVPVIKKVPYPVEVKKIKFVKVPVFMKEKKHKGKDFSMESY